MKGDKMKPWYDDIDVATLQRIKTYSAFCDYKSQNLMLQTLYEAMQKKIDEYKQTNRGIAKDYADLQKQVKELQQENTELRTKTTALENANRAMVKELDDMTSGGVSVLENVVRSKEQLTNAKEIISEYVRLANLEKEDTVAVWQLYHKAEQFLKEIEK